MLSPSDYGGIIYKKGPRWHLAVVRTVSVLWPTLKSPITFFSLSGKKEDATEAEAEAISGENFFSLPFG